MEDRVKENSKKTLVRNIWAADVDQNVRKMSSCPESGAEMEAWKTEIATGVALIVK